MKATIIRLAESAGDLAAEVGLMAATLDGKLDAPEAARAVIALQEAQGRLSHAKDALTQIAVRQQAGATIKE